MPRGLGGRSSKPVLHRQSSFKILPNAVSFFLHFSWCRGSPLVQNALQECVYSYRHHKQALLHNDFHTGNLLVTPNSMY